MYALCEAYQTYSNGLLQAVQLLDSLQANPDFQQFLKVCNPSIYHLCTQRHI